jgi:disulfide bond formation protein DsbB
MRPAIPLHPVTPRVTRSIARRGASDLLVIGVLVVGVASVGGLIVGAWNLMLGAQQFHLRDASLDGLPEVEGPVIGTEQAIRGRAIFFATCSTCHGATGRGVEGLGKDLVASAYCRGLGDDDLVAFIRAGRTAEDPKNTTRVAMPPSGGNPALSDGQVRDAVAYVRALQNRTRMPLLPPATSEHLMEVMLAMAPAPTPTTPGSATAAGASKYVDDEFETEDVAMGARLYAMSCVSCHGADGKGLPKLGKDLRDSAFVMGLDDDELITFLAKGRPTSDPLNTTKVDMPPRGGNPALNEDRLFQVVAYLRWLHKHPGEV